MTYVPTENQKKSRHGTHFILRGSGAPKGIQLELRNGRLYLTVRYKKACSDELFFRLHVRDYRSMSSCYDTAVLRIIESINMTPLEQFLLWNTRNHFRKHYGYTKAEFDLPFRDIRKIYPACTGFAVFA